MHPILGDRRRLALYLAFWAFVGGLLALALAGSAAALWAPAAVLALPLALIYGLLCLAAWYPCRSIPLDATPVLGALAAHAVAALASSGLWLRAGTAWAALLTRQGGETAATAAGLFAGRRGLFLAAGVLGYLLAAAAHYLLLAFEASRAAERRALELALAAREAELDAFKAQIDPHFLFNCLNSIAGLCGGRPAAAREMAIRLASFLRATLRLSARQAIPLAEELRLAADYLAIERVRYGDRLAVEEEVAADCRDWPVPALLLQPLLENALKHGIAERLEGGTVAIRARAGGGRLTLAVENPCDPDRRRGEGAGIGLANVRGRLALLYGRHAELAAGEAAGHFRVEIALPPAPAAGEGVAP